MGHKVRRYKWLSNVIAGGLLIVSLIANIAGADHLDYEAITMLAGILIVFSRK